MAPMDDNSMSMPAAPDSTPGGGQDAKVPESQAGYMELSGAQKDAECKKVDVQGGISSNLGCCNLFEPQDETVQQFKCGNCEYREGGQEPTGQPAEQATIPSEHPLNQLRAKRL